MSCEATFALYIVSSTSFALTVSIWRGANVAATETTPRPTPNATHNWPARRMAAGEVQMPQRIPNDQRPFDRWNTHDRTPAKYSNGIKADFWKAAPRVDAALYGLN